jgi:hypothetical protein
VVTLGDNKEDLMAIYTDLHEKFLLAAGKWINQDSKIDLDLLRVMICPDKNHDWTLILDFLNNEIDYRKSFRIVK